MSDLISRSALKVMFEKDCPGGCGCCSYAGDDFCCTLLDKAPSVDAEPLQRGHWEDDPYVWICSECHKWFECTQGDADLNYCPHCGAKMY